LKIHLVAPSNPETFWTCDRILGVLKKRSVFPNLALPTVAALTPPEHSVTILDENVERLRFDADVDVVGLTGYIVHAERMEEIGREFRRRGKLVVVGGPYASLCPEQVATWADVVFVGEAELTWTHFLEDYAARRPQRIYRADGGADVRQSPRPRFEALRIDRYRAATVQFSRGCPYDCEFCNVTLLYGRRPRTKTSAQFLAELESLRQLGVTNVFVTDDNFVGHRKQARELLREIVSWQDRHGHPLEFLTQASINVADDEELLNLLRDANFTSLFVGIESPRAASLAEANKSHNLRRDLVAAVRRIQLAGIDVMAGMIVGFDNDDPSIFEEHLRFAEEAAIPISMTGLLNALPGTRLHQRLFASGRLMGEGTGDQFRFTNVVPAGMSTRDLYAGYRRLLHSLYSYRSFRGRASVALSRIAQGRIPGGLIHGKNDVAIFLRLLWTCVMRASPRRSWMTVSLLAETLFRRPRALRSAIMFALLHRHLHGYVRAVSKSLDRLVTASSDPTAASS
jgi:radical SAM superfamily enzyme YgiQ (UPF0313 family)